MPTLFSERKEMEVPSILPRKVLLVANTSWYLCNFRGGLLRRLVEEGCEVVAVSPADPYTHRLVESGARWVEWQVDRASMSSLTNLAAMWRLYRIYRRESPVMVHHFTIKAILLGTVAAKLTGVLSIVNSVTGLGHAFLSRNLRSRLTRPFIRRWYRWALTTPRVQAIFQNSSDLEEVAQGDNKLAALAVMSQGSGVDLDRFALSVEQDPGEPRRSRALFVGRLIEEKGIKDFVDAARICCRQDANIQFIVCGSPDAGNPSTVTEEVLEAWRAENIVDFCGHVDNIEAEIAAADVVVLPSYREGTPRVLLEGAAMGKPLVATDVPGCREVVRHGETGLLTPVRDAPALADALLTVLGDKQLRLKMGKAGRRFVERSFDEREVVNQTLEVYQNGRASRAKGAWRKSPGLDLKRGILVISLDFELAWGTRGRPVSKHVAPFLDGTRDAIRGLLELFARYEVPATWAVVGALLMTSRNRFQRHPWLSGDEFSDVPCGTAETHPHWHAEDILEWLLDCPVEQELACHTLTHRFVDPSVRGRESFRNDLRCFRQLFDEFSLEQPISFIFPKAKMGHFDVLAEEGFRCIRGPEDKWFEFLPGVRLPALLRLLDARLAVPPRVDTPSRLPEGLWRLPSSQFYSPLLNVGKYVSIEARVRKAKKGLAEAARQKQLFHLWTHPFNLGVGSEQLLDGLSEILNEASRLRDEGVIDIVTMGTLARSLDAQIRLRDSALESLASTPEPLEATANV